MVSKSPPFHLAIAVDDLAAALSFYKGILGCKTGRRSERWIDFDFYGHQLVTHLVSGRSEAPANAVDGHQVPARHFGVVLDMKSWKALRKKFEALGVDFLIEPYLRFEGEVGEQATMFVTDPAGNALEFKAFANLDQLFVAE